MTDERMDGLIIDRQAFRYCKDQQPSAHGRTCYPATPRCCQILTLWGHAQWQGKGGGAYIHWNSAMPAPKRFSLARRVNGHRSFPKRSGPGHRIRSGLIIKLV